MRLRDSSSDVCSTDLPGQKIPMLPDELIQAFALDAGQSRPALSLYVQADLESGEILSTETRLERIRVRDNLRHNNLDDLVTEEALDNPDADLPYGEWLRPLWRFAGLLAAQREHVPGTPENNNRVDYSFHPAGSHEDPDPRAPPVPPR